MENKKGLLSLDFSKDKMFSEPRKSPKLFQAKSNFKLLEPLDDSKKIKKSSTLENLPGSKNILSNDEEKNNHSRRILRNNSKKLEKEGALLKLFLKDQIQKKKIHKTSSLNYSKHENISNSNFRPSKFLSSTSLLKPIISFKNDKQDLNVLLNHPNRCTSSLGLINNIVEKVYTFGSQNSEDSKETQLLIQKKKILKGLSTKHINQSKSSKNVIFNSNIINLNAEDDEDSTAKEFPKKSVHNQGREILKFNNVYDSFSEEEEEKEYIDDTNLFYIHPNKNFKVIWDTLCSILILYSMLLTPYRLAFESDSEDMFYYIELFIEFVFFTDLVLSFFTAYYRYEILVTNSSKIIWNYIKTFFFLDLLSSIPLGSIFFILQKLTLLDGSYKNLKSFTQLIRFYRLVKWVRILRLFKLNKTENSQVWKILNQIVNNVFLKFLIYFLIMIYFTSCLWCFIGKSEVDMNTYSNWIQKYSLEESPNVEIFVSAIYFVCATIFTIGYGDIVAANSLEKIFVSFLMIIGSLVWSFVLTSLSFYFSLKDESKMAFEAKIKILDEINRDYNLPHKLSDRVRKYLSFEYAKYNKDQVSLVETLPTNLKNNLLINMYQRHITHLRFFKNQSYDFIISVLPLLKCVRYLKNEYIINIGSHVEGIYMLYYGQLAVHLGTLYDHYEIARITSSYHIGDILMYANDHSPYDVRVRSRRAEMLILSKQDFASLKLLFKDAVHQILSDSNVLYEEIEMKKIAAIEYHKIYGTMKDFKLNSKNPILDLNDSFILSKKEVDNLLDLSEVKEENEDFISEDSSADSSSNSQSNQSESKSSESSSRALNKKSMAFSKSIKKIEFEKSNNTTNNYYSNIYNISPDNNKSSNLIIIKNLNINYDTKGPPVNSCEMNEGRNLKNPKRKSHSANSIVSMLKNSPNIRTQKNCDKLAKYINNKERQVFQFKKHAESFLDEINEKIVNEAILMKNKEIMSEYLKEVLKNEKFEEVKFKNLIGKLDKIESKLKNVKKIQIRLTSNYKRHKTVFN